jgi:hypothetical protein
VGRFPTFPTANGASPQPDEACSGSGRSLLVRAD